MSNNREKSSEEPSRKKQKVHRVAGVFASAILQRQVYSGTPMSMIPLRTPGLKTEMTGEPVDAKRQCKCRNAPCLRLYCHCFAAGALCGPSCKCDDQCQNNDKTGTNRERRRKAILDIIDENPEAFRSRRKYRKKGDAAFCSCQTSRCGTVSKPIVVTTGSHSGSA